MRKFKDWIQSKGLIKPTSDNLRLAKEFLWQKWQERANELSLNSPADLSNACKFASLFAQRLFGGELRGNYDHQYVVRNGEIIDLTDGTKLHHDKHFWGNTEHQDSLASCVPRVEKWIQEFLGNIK